MIITGAIVIMVLISLFISRQLSSYTSQEDRVQHVILVISDGLSWEKLKEVKPSNTNRMISTGASATFGVSEVPSVTTTNKVTIYSGAHTSTHGVVGNQYLKPNSLSVDTIQEAVERAGLSYEELTSAPEIVNKIKAGNLASFTLWWSGETDAEEHYYGPDSTQYEDAIFSIDSGIGQIMDALKKTGLDGVTILGFGSDHGAQALLPNNLDAPALNHILDLRAILEGAGYPVEKWRASGPRMAHVHLKDPAQASAAKAILEAAPGIQRAFTKSELDGAELGNGIVAYLDHKKSGDVIAFAEPEYSIGRSVVQSPVDGLDNPTKLYWDSQNDYRGGHGGLSAEEQYVPFIIWGRFIEPSCSLGIQTNANWAPTIAAFLEIEPPYDSAEKAALDCYLQR